MLMKKTMPLLLLACAACTTSSPEDVDTGPVTALPVSQIAGTPMGAISFDDGADTLLITVDGSSVATLRAKSGQGNETFDGYNLGNFESFYGFRAVSDSGASQVLIAVQDERNAVVVSQIARLADTVIPVSGEATYTGGYLGLLTRNNGSSDRAITGQVRLVASFDAGDVSGSITNRNTVTAEDLDFPIPEGQANVTFDVGTLSDDGAFSGTTQQATFAIARGSRAGTYAGSGTFNGLIAGATGDEAVGAVEIEYARQTGFNTTYTETGVFILNQETP